MIGHDLKSNSDNINNMYKSTQNYGDEKQTNTTRQLGDTMGNII